MAEEWHLAVLKTEGQPYPEEDPEKPGGPLGHNRPPSHIEFTQETAAALNDWLTSHPVVQTEDETREIKVLLDRSRLCRQDTEAERKTRVGPLQQQVRDINAEYATPLAYLDKLELEAKTRLNVWIVKEEERRRQQAAEAQLRLREAEARARDAEKREQEFAEDARQGVEVDLGSATADADREYAEYQRAEREAARLEQNIKPKITGGFSRAISQRKHEAFVVIDPDKAVAETGWTEALLGALRKEVAHYYHVNRKVPDGIIRQVERKL